jgi:hypothetical protein
MTGERGVATMGIVPTLDKVEDCHPRRDLALEAAAVEQLAFQRRKETLAPRVIETVATRPNRGAHAGVAATLAEGERSVWSTLVGMMNHGGGPTLPKRHVEAP